MRILVQLEATRSFVALPAAIVLVTLAADLLPALRYANSLDVQWRNALRAVRVSR